jgi:hypothetical protein
MKAFPLTSGAVFAFFLFMISPAHAQPAALDFTFNPGSGPGWESSGENGSQINCMALETNGQIVVGGAFSTFNGVNRSYIARLNADGGLNAAFNPGVGPSGQVNCVAVQSDGKVLIGGSFFFRKWVELEPASPPSGGRKRGYKFRHKRGRRARSWAWLNDDGFTARRADFARRHFL